MMNPDITPSGTSPIAIYGNIALLEAYKKNCAENGEVLGRALDYENARKLLLDYVRSLPNLYPNQEELWPNLDSTLKVALTYKPDDPDRTNVDTQISSLNVWADRLHRIGITNSPIVDSRIAQDDRQCVSFSVNNSALEIAP